MTLKQFFAVTVLLSLNLMPADAEDKKTPKPSGELLASITARGVLLAAYDTAAWHATDAVQALHPEQQAVHRYIARKTDLGWTVDFGVLDESGEKFMVSYQAIQTDTATNFKVTAFNPAHEDTSWDLTAARAIETSLKSFRGVNRPYNVAALPGKSGEILVYAYLAQTRAGVFPFGADARWTISADGRTVLEDRPLHKSVIEVPPVSSSQGQTAGGYHTHILTDLPEDSDVLLVLQRTPRVPEYVGAGGRVFEIDVAGKISVAK